ncbi:MAG TPA: DUF3124 domain-containing protein [Geobacteraceae bacterium]|nr:DUF3124 domain-containing protein [Geobacteraceae bacterium]
MNGRFRVTRRKSILVLVLVVWLLVALHNTSLAGTERSSGRTVYVPVYSHVYTGNRALPVNLATTLSIRNTDSANPITITGADYYGSNGKLLRRMLAKPVALGPMASTSIFIQEKDTSGGFGASFLVRWHSARPVSSPIIECLMIGAYSGLGISFVSPGQEIR